METAVKEFFKEVRIVNKLGLHARAAAQIATLAQHSASGVWIIKEDQQVDASSVIDILTLACEQGTRIIVRVDNESDLEILNGITELVENGFGE